VRIAAALFGLLFVLTGGGCLVVGATVAAAGAVVATTVKTAGKVTVATVETTGRVASATLTSSGEATALTMESAAKLARAGMVVVVDAGNGAATELPWRQGMRLDAVAQPGNPGGSFSMAKIFREGKTLKVALKGRAAGQPLHARHVVQLDH
jgi:hypothetical protein